MRYDPDTKQMFLELLERASNTKEPQNFTIGECAMLFYFQRHMTERQFNFVPKKYKKGLAVKK